MLIGVDDQIWDEIFTLVRRAVFLILTMIMQVA